MGHIDPKAYDEWYQTPFGALCHRLEKDALFSLAGFGRGERVLDAGCGTGVYLYELSRMGVHAVGLDQDRAMLDFAAMKAPGSMLVEGQLSPLPFKGGVFDKVLSVCALEFAPEPDIAVREMARVLRPGGILLLGFLNGDSVWARTRLEKAKDPASVWHGVRFLNRDEVTRMARDCGLSTLAFKGAVHFPPECEGMPTGDLEVLDKEGREKDPSTAAFIAAAFQKGPL